MVNVKTEALTAVGGIVLGLGFAEYDEQVMMMSICCVRMTRTLLQISDSVGGANLGKEAHVTV